MTSGAVGDIAAQPNNPVNRSIEREAEFEGSESEGEAEFEESEEIADDEAIDADIQFSPLSNIDDRSKEIIKRMLKLHDLEIDVVSWANGLRTNLQNMTVDQLPGGIEMWRALIGESADLLY
jgi:hypothetical protein